MLITRTKRYIIESGSFNSICTELDYATSGSLYNASAVTSSCNWDDKVWCDVTFTCDTGSRADALMESAIFITKQVWYGVQAATGSLANTHDIAFL